MGQKSKNQIIYGIFNCHRFFLWQFSYKKEELFLCGRKYMDKELD